MADEEEKKEGEEEEEKQESPEEADGGGEDGEEGEEGEGKKKGSKLKLIIIAVTVVVVVAVPAVLYLTGFFEKEQNENVRIEPVEGEEAVGEGAVVEHSVYYDMEEFIVNLNVGSKRPSFLKMTVSLELAGESQIPRIEEKMPRIRDNFQIYLRELRQEDLQGSAGLYRLREELLLRINKIVYPAKINDILFKEILVQ